MNIVLKNYKWIFLLSILLIPLSLGSIEAVKGQTTNLEVRLYPTTLDAGYNTTVTVDIINEFEPIYDVDVSLSFSAPSQPDMVASTPSEVPVVIGTGNFKFEKIEEGESVRIEPIVFTSKDSSGKGYSSYVTISYKRLGYISTQSEIHIVGFYIKGQIDMIVYEFSVEPDPVVAGSEIIITASLLNKGTIEASYTNVSLTPNPILIQKLESYSYIGEVDPNSPAPFTLEAIVNEDTGEGTYPIKIRIEYEDEESKVYVINRELEAHIVGGTKEEGTKSTSDLIVDFIKGNLIFLLIGIIIAIIVIILLLRRRTSKEEFE
ncbi:hypothetical protein [[Eubacterium] cellulosolvens]